jgi:xanthine dehydrogenase accessory factor
MFYQKVLDLQGRGQSLVIATITNVKGSAPREVGAKMIVSKEEIFSTIGGGALEQFVIDESRKLIDLNQSQKSGVPLCSKVSQCCGGFVEIFFDVVMPPTQLFIFGAGHVAQSLLEVMTGTDFSCHLIDARSEWIELAEAKKKSLSQLSLTTYCENPLNWISSHPEILTSSYCLVMTHDHELDQQIIEQLVQNPVQFLGLIGSSTKRERFIQRLGKKGIPLEQLTRIRCPVGKQYQGDFKSKLPKAVALSIGFELIELQSLNKKDKTSHLQNELTP